MPSNKLVPKRVFFTHGTGKNRIKLASFELALRDAGIEKLNLVKVSSILPPECGIVSPEDGLDMLEPGEITYCVLSRCETDHAEDVASAIGLAIPSDRAGYGYLSEHHGVGDEASKAGQVAEDVAATMLATSLGLAFDADKGFDERRHELKASGKIYKTEHTSSIARGQEGTWTTTVAAAVFIM